LIVSARGGTPHRINAHTGIKAMPSYSPDGRWIAYHGSQSTESWWQAHSLYLTPTRGGGKARLLASGRGAGDLESITLADIGGIRPTMRPHWSPDGKRIYCVRSAHGQAHIVRIDVEDHRRGYPREFVPLTTGSEVHSLVTFDRSSERAACLHSTPRDPGQISTIDLANGERRALTGLNAFLIKKGQCELEEVWLGEGRNKLHGWILKPASFSASRKYPSILQIHGGPHLQYGNTYMHEFHYLASQGYVVHFCNPRGSRGYGDSHAKAIRNNWGGPDYEDIMRWTDHVSRRPYIDRRRMGVIGGSYGGYMTNWIIGHTRRFSAAVTDRCISNLVSFYGTSDFNWYFQKAFGNRPPWQDLENYWRQSPIKYIARAITPTLIVHSELDHRCPIEQAEQLFVALKKLGVPTRMVRYPDESHGMSRGGRTDRRIERLKLVKEWFDQYLGKVR
jgi:dipeptidyl aminopeptidase/acylaminoacyl peptidase